MLQSHALCVVASAEHCWKCSARGGARTDLNLYLVRLNRARYYNERARVGNWVYTIEGLSLVSFELDLDVLYVERMGLASWYQRRRVQCRRVGAKVLA